MTSPSGQGLLDDVASIAVIDNDFVLSIDRLPEAERPAALEALSDVAKYAPHDVTNRGLSLEALTSAPNDVLNALAAPEHGLGDAFAYLSQQSELLAKMLQDNHTMRALAAHMRAACDADVIELCPDDVPPDLSDFQLVFLDYYLEDDSEDTDRAEEIARRTTQSNDGDPNQQVVLMSSLPTVRNDRRQFRAKAELAGAAFAFVAKDELDSAWKVKAHLRTLAQALPQSRVLLAYVNSVKTQLKHAVAELGTLLDDLDLGDFAHLQNLALQADGHPLGDYLSWLTSSHLTALAFERGLRELQDKVDAVEFDSTLVHPLQLSDIITTLHHSALFSRNIGPLRKHPRERAASGPLLPMVRLGDVYFNDQRSKTVVVLSADCALSFSPGAGRSIDTSTAVLLVPGTPFSIHSSCGDPNHTSTIGVEYQSEVYRIDWDFRRYYSVEIQKLHKHLNDNGYDTTDRDRLRPLYALQLQQQFSSALFRVGSPIPPPFQIRISATVIQCRPRIRDLEAKQDTVHTFDEGEVHAAYTHDQVTIRITANVADVLKSHLQELHTFLVESTDTITAPRAKEHHERRVQAIADHLDDDEKWVSVLGDQLLPKYGKAHRLMNGLFLTSGVGFSPQNQTGVVLRIVDRRASPSS